MGIKSKDLAKLLGVSTATMSLVLNNKPGISAELRQKLTDQIQEMGHGYMLSAQRPAAPVREGAKEKSKIAYVIYNSSTENRNEHSAFYPAVLEGVETEAESRGFEVRILHMSHRCCSLSACIDPHETLGIVVQVDFLTDEIVDALEATGVPFVVIDCYRSDRRVSAVCVNNEDGISNAVNYLASLGHTKIGYVASGRDTNCFVERRRCFHLAMREHQLPDPSAYKYFTGSDDCEAVTVLLKLWKNCESMPTALVAENDILAWRSIKTLKKLGYRIPEDISVIGFDDSPTAALIDPPLTTLQVYRHLIGRETVIMLYNKWRLHNAGVENIPTKLNVGVSLVVRESTGPVRK